MVHVLNSVIRRLAVPAAAGLILVGCSSTSDRNGVAATAAEDSNTSSTPAASGSGGSPAASGGSPAASGGAAAASGGAAAASAASGGAPASSSPGCGSAPVASGPAAGVAVVVLSAPASAAAGDVLTVRAQLRVLSDGARIITDPALSDVLVVRDGRVVGRSSQTRPDYAVPLVLRAGAVRPLQAVPSTVSLTGCPPSGADAGVARTDLVPGSYQLVAVLGYRTDSLNSMADGAVAKPSASARSTGRAFQLVSAPVPITIR